MAEAAPVQSTEFSPLQIPLVLKKILEGSTVAELKEYRKVCQSWNMECSKVLRKSAELEVTTFGRSGHDFTLDKFMTLLDNQMCVFTRKDSFPESVLFSDVEYDAKFWKQFGCLIKSLKLEDLSFPSPKHFREAIFDSCPNLEKLEMTNVQLLGVDGPWTRFPDYDFSDEDEASNGDEDAKADSDSNDYPQHGHQAVNKNLKYLELKDFDDEYFPVSLFKRVFNHFPNLEALHVTDCTKESSNAIFLALKDWLQNSDGRAEKLKEVGLHFVDFRNPNKAAKILTSGKLRLEKLELEDLFHRRYVNVAPRILEGHAATLKKLKLQGYGSDDGQQPVFPLSNGVILGELEEMTLVWEELELTNLWKCVPNLKRLVLKCTCLSRAVSVTSIQELRNVALNSCVEIELQNCVVENGSDQTEVARKLAALLPNVQKLKLQDGYLSTSTRFIQVFSIVCDAFPKLVELRVFTSHTKLLDSVITGLDLEHVEKINREGKNGDWKPKSVPRAGIAKLKDLEVLSIRCEEGLGYSSAVSGIQRLPQLQQLHLEFQKVDEEAWNGIWKPLLAQFPWRGN